MPNSAAPFNGAFCTNSSCGAKGVIEGEVAVAEEFSSSGDDAESDGYKCEDSDVGGLPEGIPRTVRLRSKDPVFDLLICTTNQWNEFFFFFFFFKPKIIPGEKKKLH